ncbi:MULTISPECIES: ROK family protein [Paenibacillus]|uniref:ROK family protein n=1 Tax=Paenibacillus TaxID=44249 RepID=UPI0004B2D370|nr:ROK family protein [Paenibacillus sp. IHBB 10380]
MCSYRNGGEKEALAPAELTLALDAGGTYLKGALLLDGQIVPESFMIRPSASQGTAAAAIGAIAGICMELLEGFASGNRPLHPEDLVRIGFAFPGPFDYDTGTALMQGVGKYENLYRLSVPDLLGKEFQRLRSVKPGIVTDSLAAADMRFGNDAFMFGLGAGARFPSERLICLTLGTGLGSAFVVRGRIITGKQGVPRGGMLYNEPYGDDIVDNRFGKRGILRMAAAQGIAAKEADVADLAKAAKQGHEAPLRLFQNYGAQLGNMLLPYVAVFKPDRIVLGGQISGSYPLWEESFRQSLGSRYVPALALQDGIRDVFYGIHTLFKDTDRGHDSRHPSNSLQ